MPAFLVQIVTGLWLSHQMFPDVSDWFNFETPAARIIGIKLLLLALTVTLAIDARLRIIPKLTEERLTALAWHIIPVTLISVLFVMAGVSFLTG